MASLSQIVWSQSQRLTGRDGYLAKLAYRAQFGFNRDDCLQHSSLVTKLTQVTKFHQHTVWSENQITKGQPSLIPMSTARLHMADCEPSV